MRLIHSIRNFLGREFRFWSLRRTYKRFRMYTMIPENIYIENLILARRIMGVPGCIVECGVWKGGMSAGLATLFDGKRAHYLFDSFEGLPPAEPIDGEAALAWQLKTDDPSYHDNCSADENFAKNAMQNAGCTNYTLIKGWFDKSLPDFKAASPIALLRLDADWYESTMVCLESLYDQVANGGLIVLDDYYAWEGCSKALHDFLSKRSLKEKIRCVGDVCFFIKSSSS